MKIALPLPTLFATLKLTSLAIAVGSVVHPHIAQAASGEAVEVVTIIAKRDNRQSSGATKLPLDIKDTPQSITIISQRDMTDYNLTGSNQALSLGTGINVDQYETNRATFNARGFEIQLTQVDGLGLTNSFGTVVGQLDTYVFDKIELIRGANGLLTGVGNASGTINYVRKRPVNADAGEVSVFGGSYGFKRVAADYNKVLTDDGRWAGRIIAAYEDKDSHLRALQDERSTVYGVIDGQIGDSGMLTMGMTLRKAEQESPMWGSLTLFYPDGSMADFDRSASTSQDWTYWNTRAHTAFIEYTQQLAAGWEAKLTYNLSRSQEDTRLLYAFSGTNALNTDNTGLSGWPYSSQTDENFDAVDANISGVFRAFGQEHNAIFGVSSATQDQLTEVYEYDAAAFRFLPLPAFPYAGNVYPQPAWSPKTPSTEGEQTLSRFYGATKINVTDRFKTIAGVNAVRLDREGNSQYGNPATQTEYPRTDEVSPYVGLTYDITDAILGYVSYSDIFQNQDQTDIDGVYLDAMKGVNHEVGVKAEWLDRRLLTTLAVFGAEQKGLATFAGINAAGQYYYSPVDVDSKGTEVEVVGNINDTTNIVLGISNLELTGADGKDIYEWIPRTTVNLRIDTQLPSLPQLRMGIGGRWQSEMKGSYAEQGSYLLTNAFLTYSLSNAASVRINFNNLFDEKYLHGLAYGAIYGAGRNGSVALSYSF